MPTVNSIASRALLFSATITLLGVVAVITLTAACRNENGSPIEPTSTETNGAQDGTVVTGGNGKLDHLQINEAKVGDEIVVTGSAWTAVRPVRFYLLTKEQLQAGLFDQRHAITLGDATPEHDGAVAFSFRLASNYQTPSESVRIQAGQQWYVAAFQSLGQGSHGTGVGPLTVK